MKFGDMTSRIVLLKPDYHFENDVGETVPAWVPSCPYRPDMYDNPPVVTLTEGDNIPRYTPGKTEADLSKYCVWAKVTPTSGREYEEAQKIRAELTYKIKIRYADNVRSDFKVLYRDKVLSVESVIDLGGTGRELELVCSEVEGFGETEGCIRVC